MALYYTQSSIVANDTMVNLHIILYELVVESSACCSLQCWQPLNKEIKVSIVDSYNYINYLTYFVSSA